MKEGIAKHADGASITMGIALRPAWKYNGYINII